MPFANHPEFVFPFASMSLSQIQTLRRQCRAMPDAMVCEYDVDVYVLKLTEEQVAVDHTLLLFAAACILLRGLSQTRALDRGIMCAYLTEKPDRLAHHANAILFQIVHACSLRRGALQEAMKLLQKHNVQIRSHHTFSILSISCLFLVIRTISSLVVVILVVVSLTSTTNSILTS